MWQYIFPECDLVQGVRLITAGITYDRYLSGVPYQHQVRCDQYPADIGRVDACVGDQIGSPAATSAGRFLRMIRPAVCAPD